jgi:hypothetical protein
VFSGILLWIARVPDVNDLESNEEALVAGRELKIPVDCRMFAAPQEGSRDCVLDLQT